jgi:HNH endonuclease
MMTDAQIKVARTRAACRQNWRCHWCGLAMCTEPNCPWQVSLDHVVPKHAGGEDRPDNYVAAHRKCNAERHPELNRRPHSEPVLVATTGETARSPFEILKGL